MAVEQDEAQAREFLKRAEIVTMRKDLMRLREADALKARERIIKANTDKPWQPPVKINIQVPKPDQEIDQAKELADAARRQEIIQKSARQEQEAEKSVKGYANEPEKQQIFILESQKLELQNKIGRLREKLEPAILVEKNKTRIELRDWEAKLRTIALQEEKIEDEQRIISEREKATKIPSEQKSMENRRWELEDKRHEIEKKRWELEKNVKDLQTRLKKTEDDYNIVVDEKNRLKMQADALEATLRDVYLKIASREDQNRQAAKAQEKQAQTQAAEVAGQRKEDFQRGQWKKTYQPGEKQIFQGLSEKAKEKLAQSAAAEEEQRQKFLQDVENQTK